MSGFGEGAVVSGYFPGYRDPAVIEEVRGGAVSLTATCLPLRGRARRTYPASIFHAAKAAERRTLNVSLPKMWRF